MYVSASVSSLVAREGLISNVTALTSTHESVEKLLDELFYMEFMSFERKVGRHLSQNKKKNTKKFRGL
jgi:hypothetical protein